MYVTAEDLRQRFGAEIDQFIDARGEGTVTAACADASAVIDSYLAVRYQVPVQDAPELLRSVAADIARYKLWDDEAPETVVKRHDDAIAYLRRLSSGEALLVGATGANTDTDLALPAYKRGRKPLDMSGF